MPDKSPFRGIGAVAGALKMLPGKLAAARTAA